MSWSSIGNSLKKLGGDALNFGEDAVVNTAKGLGQGVVHTANMLGDAERAGLGVVTGNPVARDNAVRDFKSDWQGSLPGQAFSSVYDPAKAIGQTVIHNPGYAMPGAVGPSLIAKDLIQGNPNLMQSPAGQRYNLPNTRQAAINLKHGGSLATAAKEYGKTVGTVGNDAANIYLAGAGGAAEAPFKDGVLNAVKHSAVESAKVTAPLAVSQTLKDGDYKNIKGFASNTAGNFVPQALAGTALNFGGKVSGEVLKASPEALKSADSAFREKVNSGLVNPEAGNVKLPGAPTETPQIKTLRDPNAERAVQEVLKNGGTFDEAMHAYWQEHPGVGQHDVSQAVARVAKDSGIPLERNPTENPLRGTKSLPAVPEGNAEQAHLNADMLLKQERSVGIQALEAFNGLSEHDKQLLKDIETRPMADVLKDAENPEAFSNAEKNIRTYYDTRDAWDHYLGIDHGYRANYLRQLFDRAEEEGSTPIPVSGGSKRPGYTQARTSETLGTDVATALEKDIQGATYNHAKLAYAKGLNEAFPGKVKVGEIVQDKGKNYQQLRTPYGNDLTADPEIANAINKRAVPTPVDNKGVQAYDKVNRGLKSAMLSGGGFHGLTEAFNFAGQQLASPQSYANPLETVKANARVIGSTFSKAIADQSFEHFNQPSEFGSTMDKANIAGLTLSQQEIRPEANHEMVGSIKIANPLTAMHDAVFKREIPIQKLSVFEQATKGLDINNPEDIAKMRQVANATNHIFGGINRAVDGMSPETARKINRFVLAGDFTESKFRTLNDALTKGGPQGDIARQAVIGKTIVASVPGIVSLAMAGQLRTDDAKELAKQVLGQILDPSVVTPFKNKSGGSKVASLPATFISEFGRFLWPLINGSPDKLGDEKTQLQNYATSRMAALPSTAIKLFNNSDYYGNPIIESDQNGIKLGKSAINLASNSAPIPVNQAIKVAQGSESIPEAVTNTIGLRTKTDPNDPNMKSLGYQTSLVRGLDKDAQNAWNLVHGKSKDQHGNPTPTVVNDSVIGKYASLLNKPDLLQRVINADNQIAQYKKQQGLATDPFYDLSPDQQMTLMVIKDRKNLDAKDVQAKIMEQTNDPWLRQYYKAKGDYASSFKGNNTAPPETIVNFPTVTSSLKQNFDEMNNLPDSASRAEYLKTHPELTDYYAAYDQAVRRQHDYFNEPQYKEYPTASPQLDAVMSEYNALPKGTGARSAWIRQNPAAYQAMNDFYSLVSQYNLNSDASRAQFEGQDYSQKGLKAIKNIAAYDLLQNPDGTLAIAGSSGAQSGAVALGNGGGGGYSSKSKKLSYKKTKKMRKMYVRHPKKIRLASNKPKMALRTEKKIALNGKNGKIRLTKV